MNEKELKGAKNFLNDLLGISMEEVNVRKDFMEIYTYVTGSILDSTQVDFLSAKYFEDMSVEDLKYHFTELTNRYLKDILTSIRRAYILGFPCSSLFSTGLGVVKEREELLKSIKNSDSPDGDLLSKVPVEVLNLNTRYTNNLRKAGYYTLYDLYCSSVSELSVIRGLGKNCLVEVATQYNNVTGLFIKS